VKMGGGPTDRATNLPAFRPAQLFHLCNREHLIVDGAVDAGPGRYLLFTYPWHYPAMEPMGRVLGPASTNFNDYLGTVAADDAAAVMDEPSLYELAEVDRDRYTILAVDLTVNGGSTATVYAIDRVEHPDALRGEITDRGQSHGDVPVVRFDLPEASAEEFIKRAFSRISFRLVTQPLRDHALVVTEPRQTRGHRGLTKSSLAC
jgi:hypothetical protein